MIRHALRFLPLAAGLVLSAAPAHAGFIMTYDFGIPPRSARSRADRAPRNSDAGREAG